MSVNWCGQCFRERSITNNGLLVGDQDTDATLRNEISGSGALDKWGKGTLTLLRANAYAGASNVASLSNAGAVSLLGAAAGSKLTVDGKYVGNNGVLKLGTVLNEGFGPSDRLVLNGPAAVASGHTNVEVTNVGGLGALTSGNGIEVITAQNGATTTAQTTKDAFSLAGGHIDAGAYQYRLYAADAKGAGENWYLRSTNSMGLPSYRPEVSLYSALPNQLRQGNLTMLGDMRKREGDDDVTGSTVATGDSQRRT